MRLSSTVLLCDEGYDLIPRNVAAKNVWLKVTLCICLNNKRADGTRIEQGIKTILSSS